MTKRLPELNPLLDKLELDTLANGLQIIDAHELETDAFPRLDTDRPALLMRIGSASLDKIVTTLRVNYPADHPVALVAPDRIKRRALDAMAEQKSGKYTALFVPPLPNAGSPLTIANIMARLRAPVGGCPWDLEQTHESITRALIEETYEVIEAISDYDMPHLKEELGDLFLHVLFQTQIARDQNEFSLSQVGIELAEKLIRRHPHVFGDEQAHSAGKVLENWERIKREEKKNKGESHPSAALDAGIPRHLPALTRAQKISERARRKTHGETSNRRITMRGALARKIEAAQDREQLVGELLLEIAASAEQHGIDAERALHAASRKSAQKKE